MEYRDGELVDRNVGEVRHSRVQAAIAGYLCDHEKEWACTAYVALTIRVRENWYALPDVCLYDRDFEGRYPSVPPLLWIEILSGEDRMVNVWRKSSELIANGVPYVWWVDSETLKSELRSASGTQAIEDQTLRLPNSPIVVPLREVWKRR